LGWCKKSSTKKTKKKVPFLKKSKIFKERLTSSSIVVSVECFIQSKNRIFVLFEINSQAIVFYVQTTKPTIALVRKNSFCFFAGTQIFKALGNKFHHEVSKKSQQTN